MKRCIVVAMAASAVALVVLTAAARQAPKGEPKTGVNDPSFHRDAITRIAQGQGGEVIDQLQALGDEGQYRLETLYTLAVACAHEKDVAKAMDYARKAVAAGLPIDRFVAGPRDLLAPLTGSAEFQALLHEHPLVLVHGPMLGAVTDSAARIWVRTPAEAAVRVAVSASPDMKNPIAPPEAKTSRDADFTAVVEVGGLRPATTYYYSVSVDGRGALEKPAAFQTFPKVGSPARFQVAFGGGANYAPNNERMWDVILKRRPAALLMLGDNVYIDTPQVPATQQYCYYRRQSRPEWRRLVSATPVFAIYDDHDFFANDCVPGPDIDKPPYKRPVWRLFCENWANPSYGGGEKQPGCWFNFRIGDVDFFMLDCRFYRDLASRPPTMLGPVQKRLFLEALKQSRATFRVLASSVPWAKGTKPGSKDTWDGFEEEREEIFKFLESNGIGGVVLISADRHRSDVWRVPRPGYTLFEFESSKLTNLHTHPPVEGCEFSYNKTCSVEFLEFDTTAADPTVTCRIVTIDDETVHTFTVKRSQLAPAK